MEDNQKLLPTITNRTSRKFSKSKINDYKNCPRKYYFANRTDLNTSIREDKNYKTHLGSVVHKIIELYNDPNADDDTINMHLECLDETEDGLEFCKKNIKTFFNILDKYGLNRASYFEYRVEDQELNLSGNIDAIYEITYDGVDEIWVIDYKTGRFYKNKMKDYIFELYVYVILCKRALGINVDRVGMFFTNHPRSSFVIEVTEEEYKENFSKMVEYMREMEGNNFPRKRSKLCEYCKFVNLCDAYRDEIIKD